MDSVMMMTKTGWVKETRLEVKRMNEMNKKSGVETPGWKYVEVLKPSQILTDPLQKDDAVEDISEAAVRRRHAKPEKEEKLAKRWDKRVKKEKAYAEALKKRMEEREQRYVNGRRKSYSRRKGFGNTNLGQGQDKTKATSTSGGDEEILYILVADTIPSTGVSKQ